VGAASAAEHVVYATSALAAPGAITAAVARELEAALTHEIRVPAGGASGGASGAPDVAPPDSVRLEGTASLLRRFPTVRVRVESDSTDAARRQALQVKRFLVARGVPAEQVAVAVRGRLSGARVMVDTIGALR
jgi:hypothetical protein